VVIFEAGDACQKVRSNHYRKLLIPWSAGADLSLGKNDKVLAQTGYGDAKPAAD
jgi:hypothetical protein